MPGPPVPGPPPPQEPSPRERPAWPTLLPLVAGMMLVAVFASLVGESDKRPEPTYSDFIAQVEARQVRSAKLDAGDNSVDVTTKNGRKYQTAYPDNTEEALVSRCGSAASRWTSRRNAMAAGGRPSSGSDRCCCSWFSGCSSSARRRERADS
jgi:ATP-dependent Zn protease